MPILQLYPPKSFYTQVESSKFFKGQFCWIVSPYLNPIPQILDVERNRPDEHIEARFIIRNANLNEDFKTNRVLPLKSLKSNEEFLVQKAKKRLGIILSVGADTYLDIDKLLRSKGKKHLHGDPVFIIPRYSIETETNKKSGFASEMVTRIRCLLYKQYFYFPNNDKFEEGIARFDRIQVVEGKDPSAIRPTDIYLSEEIFVLFRAMFIFCISGIELNELNEIRTLMKEAYNLSLQ